MADYMTVRTHVHVEEVSDTINSNAQAAGNRKMVGLYAGATSK